MLYICSATGDRPYSVSSNWTWEQAIAVSKVDQLIPPIMMTVILRNILFTVEGLTIMKNIAQAVRGWLWKSWDVRANEFLASKVHQNSVNFRYFFSKTCSLNKANNWGKRFFNMSSSHNDGILQQFLRHIKDYNGFKIMFYQGEKLFWTGSHIAQICWRHGIPGNYLLVPTSR